MLRVLRVMLRVHKTINVYKSIYVKGVKSVKGVSPRVREIFKEINLNLIKNFFISRARARTEPLTPLT